MPFCIGIGEVFELRIGHEVLVHVKVPDTNRMSWDLILEQVRVLDAKNCLKSRDIAGVDSNLDGTSTN